MSKNLPEEILAEFDEKYGAFEFSYEVRKGDRDKLVSFLLSILTRLSEERIKEIDERIQKVRETMGKYDVLGISEAFSEGYDERCVDELRFLEHLRSLAGTHLDPKVVDAFLQVVAEVP